MACFDDLQDRNFLHTAMRLRSENLETGQTTEEHFHINTICIGGVAFFVIAVPESFGMGCDPAFMTPNGYVQIWPFKIAPPPADMSISTNVALGVHETLYMELCPDGISLPPIDPVTFAD